MSAGQGWVYPIWITLRAKSIDGRFLNADNRGLFLGYLAGFTEPVEDDRMRAALSKALLGD
jgi:hypothetical protein